MVCTLHSASILNAREIVGLSCLLQGQERQCLITTTSVIERLVFEGNLFMFVLLSSDVEVLCS
jgi:hypothetical protein